MKAWYFKQAMKAAGMACVCVVALFALLVLMEHMR